MCPTQKCTQYKSSKVFQKVETSSIDRDGDFSTFFRFIKFIR